MSSSGKSTTLGHPIPNGSRENISPIIIQTQQAIFRNIHIYYMCVCIVYICVCLYVYLRSHREQINNTMISSPIRSDKMLQNDRNYYTIYDNVIIITIIIVITEYEKD